MSLEAMKMARKALRELTTIRKGCDCPTCHADELLRLAIKGAKKPRVDAVNMKQERVDETAKREHEPWPSVQCVCGGTIYFKYTPPVSDYHEGWEEGFKAAKREWVGLTDEEARKFYEKYTNREELIYAIDKFLEEKNNG
jgi:hypothetical protein